MIDLKPACREMAEVLAGVGDEQLADPTPCDEYTVADLIRHIDEVSAGFAGLAGQAVPETGEAEQGLRFADGWQDGVREHVLALGETWDDPKAWEGSTNAGDLELPNGMWGRIAFTEIVVHGWDLAKATGRPFDLPEATLRACLDHVTEFVPKAPVPELWGPTVEVSADAPLIDRVVAVTGRRP